MTTPAGREQAARRLDEFERRMHEAATAIGGGDAAELARATVHLASHAALPVALDPGFLHLIRINFFVDKEPLPYWTEGRLLLSRLCREVEECLYEMDPAVRDLLLDRLRLQYGPDRIAQVATLLWQYTEQHTEWVDRRALRHAQQVTALNFLEPDRARAWLTEAEQGAGSESLPAEWFLALRGEMPQGRASQQAGSARSVWRALWSLDYAPQVRGFSNFLSSLQSKSDDSPTFRPAVLVLSGPPRHGHRWLTYRLLSIGPAFALTEMTWENRRPPRSTDIAARLIEPAQTRPQALVVNGIERFDEDELVRITRSLIAPVEGKTTPQPLILLLVDKTGRWTDPDPSSSRIVFPFVARLAFGLPRLVPFSLQTLTAWLAALPMELHEELSIGDPAAVAGELFEGTNGIPEAVFERFCIRCGVRWDDVDAEARAALLPPRGGLAAFSDLAAEYDATRAARTPGPERTEALESIVARMRIAMAGEPARDLDRWISSDSAGVRLLATVALELAPDPQRLEWLAQRVDPSAERPLMGFHALLALLHATETLPAADLPHVEHALAVAAEFAREIGVSTDRARTLAAAQAALKRRQAGRETLNAIAVTDQVVFPTVRTSLRITMSLEKVRRALSGDSRTFVAWHASHSDGLTSSELPVVGTIARIQPGGGESVETALAAYPDIELIAEGLARARAVSVRTEKGTPPDVVLVDVEPLPEPRQLEAVLEPIVLTAHIRRLFRRLPQLSGWHQAADDAIEPLRLCYLVASVLNIPPAEKLRILEADELSDKLTLVAKVLEESVERELPADPVLTDPQIKQLVLALASAFPTDTQMDSLVRAALDRPLSTVFDKPVATGTLEPGELAAEVVLWARRHRRLRSLLAGAIQAAPDDPHLKSIADAVGAAKAPGPPLEAAARRNSRLWPNGSELRIKFLDGEKKVQDRVLSVARQWLEYANLKFRVLERGSREPADIRISFKQEGSWSYVGSSALNTPADQPTMNFGWLTPSTPSDHFQEVVLREFGHALGLILEHQNPQARIEWNREVVLHNMTGPPNNWSREETEKFFFNRYSQDEIGPYRTFDPQSIMMNRFPREWTADGRELRGGTSLSESDKRLIQAYYPWENRRPGSGLPAARKTPPTRQPRAASSVKRKKKK